MATLWGWWPIWNTLKRLLSGHFGTGHCPYLRFARILGPLISYVYGLPNTHVRKSNQSSKCEHTVYFHMHIHQRIHLYNTLHIMYIVHVSLQCIFTTQSAQINRLKWTNCLTDACCHQQQPCLAWSKDVMVNCFSGTRHMLTSWSPELWSGRACLLKPVLILNILSWARSNSYDT